MFVVMWAIFSAVGTTHNILECTVVHGNDDLIKMVHGHDRLAIEHEYTNMTETVL